ncbi:MAG: cupin domain-containing protein [Proteobacteria bacterium]|nr:cupin domain-containing protein [Pseudomonadota bacterium]MDA0994108.1 cupin domain-containing protein [Pseudomonadota bacterium]
MRLGSWLLLLLLLVAGGAGSEQNEKAVSGFINLQAEDVLFVASPDVAGLSYAILSGDPDSAGVYVIRLRISPGLVFPPHFHDQDRHVTVISGDWAFGTGKSGECEDTLLLTAGAYALHSKEAVHFDGACGDEPVEVQIIGLGPVATTWVADSD